jgi:hypothetical protein
MGVARWALLVVGAVMGLIGAIWILQGIGVLPGSFMTGQSFWAWTGGGTLTVGMGLVALALRRPSVR